MALTPILVNKVIKTLTEVYGKNSVNYDGKKVITVYVDDADRNYRKNQLKQIQNLFSPAPYSAKYTVPTSGGKTGAVKLAPVEIQVKASLIAKPTSTGKAKFKPSDINPPIVNVWLSSKDIANNVKEYVLGLELDKEIEKEILNLLKQTSSDTRTSIPFDVPKDLVPAEFFEILSAVKLSILLESNNLNIRKILGIPKNMDLSESKIKIYIPQKANFPLIDYYISITKSTQKDEESALKISVKSKVKSPKANTVKFKDVFKNEKSVDDWYIDLTPQIKMQQKGPKIIAESALTVYGNYSGKALSGIPIFSVLNLLKNDRQKINSLIVSKFQGTIDIDTFKRVLEKVYKNLNRVSTSTNLSEIIDDKKDLNKISSMILGNMSKTGGQTIEISVYNLAYLCEKLLVSSSKETSNTKYNFYQMFFDEVLTKKKIAYAVSSIKGKQLVYEFFSMVNFEREYKSWLELRSKNSPNSPNDVIGIDV